MACREIHQKGPSALHIGRCSHQFLPGAEEWEGRVRASDVPVSPIFSCYADAMEPGEPSAEARLDRAFADAAHGRGRPGPRFRFGRDRHKYATDFTAISAWERAK